MGRNTSGGASPGAQTAAHTFCCVYLSKAALINRDGAFGAGFHANTAGNAHLAFYNSQFFHKLILSGVFHRILDDGINPIIPHLGMISIGMT